MKPVKMILVEIRFLFLIIFGTFILSSCQSGNDPISPDKKEGGFPMTIGSVWEYDVTDTTYYYYAIDSIKINNGILQVKIVGKTFLENRGEALIWQFKFLNNLDSLYVLESGDTTLFYQDKNNLSPIISFIFPLEVNNSWQHSECCKYEVLGKEILNLPSGVFTNVYDICENNSCEGEAGLKIKYYLEPNVGIVKYQSDYQNIHYSIKREKEWNLRSYSLAR